MKAFIYYMFFLWFLPHVCVAQQYGSSGWSLDRSKFDSKYPIMQKLCKTNVEGGIPTRYNAPLTIIAKKENQIQKSIDLVHKKGGGVVVVPNGTHIITQPIKLKTNVILGGQTKGEAIQVKKPMTYPNPIEDLLNLSGVKLYSEVVIFDHTMTMPLLKPSIREFLCQLIAYPLSFILFYQNRPFTGI